MDKNQVIGFVLILGILTVYSIFFVKPQKEAAARNAGFGSEAVAGAPATEGTFTGASGAPLISPSPLEKPLKKEDVLISTDLVKARISTRGASLTSLILNPYKDKDRPLEMINREESPYGAFNIFFSRTAQKNNTRDVLFRVSQKGSYAYDFSRDFDVRLPDGKTQTVTLTKSYRFKPGEYLFELDISLKNKINDYLPLNDNGTSYTLEFAPQIGPRFKKLDGRTEFRQYLSFSGNKLKKYKLKKNELMIQKLVSWVAVNGKYFSFIGVPDASPYQILFSDRPIPGVPTPSRILFRRGPIKSSVNKDTFRFYLGPNNLKSLSRYRDASDNAFGISGLQLDKIISQGFLTWLENILLWLLRAIYGLIPNYGVAIILLTVLIKILLFPLTHKSYESTSRMQKIQPQIQELQKRLKGEPQKLNAALAALYKKEKVNPMGGCLPMLLQLPIFLTLFRIFNKYFDFRGAPFIHGWIDDLSRPESVFHFQNSFLSGLGITDIRILPFLFVGTQLLTSFMMSGRGGGAQNNQMKTFGYIFTFMFFFLFYNSPSGLLLYWIVSNSLTVVQQYWINRKQNLGN